MERWVGKVAVVSGASSGIGAAVSVRLADAGLRVMGLARRPQLVQELSSQIKGKGSIHARQCDVSNSQAVAEAFDWIKEQFGGVDVMVNNAGVVVPGNITDLGDKQISDEEVASILDTNIKGTLLCTRRAIHYMKERSVDGHVININSIAGHYVPFSVGFNVYPGSKHAITAFTGTLLNELANMGSRIRVTSISPGLVDTAMTAAVRSLQLPMLRPEDVADAVLYALSVPPTVNINEITISAVGEKRL